MLVALSPSRAHASFLDSGTVDTIADVLTWVVLIVAPLTAIVVFLLIHILPEKIAEKRRHPQTKAIQTLCILSLFFGGLLWPLAWIWAYTKPVLHKMAYGTDAAEDHGVVATRAVTPVNRLETVNRLESEEVSRIRERLDALSARMPSTDEVRALRKELASLKEHLSAAERREV